MTITCNEEQQQRTVRAREIVFQMIYLLGRSAMLSATLMTRRRDRSIKTLVLVVVQYLVHNKHVYIYICARAHQQNIHKSASFIYKFCFRRFS